MRGMLVAVGIVLGIGAGAQTPAGGSVRPARSSERERDGRTFWGTCGGFGTCENDSLRRVCPAAVGGCRRSAAAGIRSGFCPAVRRADLAGQCGRPHQRSQLRIAYFSLSDFIAMAYGVKTAQIAGPDWVAQERFDIAAKLPDGASRDNVPAMLQALLADRFQLKVHRDSKEFPVYALAVAKSGPKLHEAAESADADASPSGNVNVAASGSSAGVNFDLGGSSLSLANDKLRDPENDDGGVGAYAHAFCRSRGRGHDRADGSVQT